MTGISEVFTLESGNGFTVEVTVSESVDTLKNTSDVTVGLRVKSAYYKNYIYYLSGSVKIDGTALVTMNSTISTHNVSITAYNTYYNVVRSSDSYTDSPWTLAGIAHNTDGSKSVKLELEVRGYTYGGGGSGWSVSTSRTLTLTHIPRASTIGATDANIGVVSNIAVSRKSTAYTHTIAYAFGALSGYIGEDGALSGTAVKLTDTAVAFSIPERFYGQIPTAPKGICTLTCRTYSGSTQVGDAQTATFTVTASKDLCAPTVSGTVVDTNAATIALTGDENILVRYVSDALCTITATAKNSASIDEKTIGGTAVTGTTRTISDIQSGSVVFACTDSRGYGASATVNKTLVPYIHLTANVTAKRTDPTSGNATLTITGKVYNGAFGAANNALTVQYAINGGTAVTLPPTIDGDTYTATASLTGLDYQNAHTIAVTVSDRLETVKKSVTVGKGIPVFDWGENDFQFHVPVFIQGENVLGKLGGIQITNCNAATGNGWYYSYGGALNAPVDGAFSMLVVAYGPDALTQVMFFGTDYSANTYCAIRKRTASAWNAWEYVNPPMLMDMEYQTLERWGGAAVYTKLINLGTTTASMSTTIPISGITRLLRAVPNLGGSLVSEWDANSGINAALNKFYFCPEMVSGGVYFYVSCGTARVGKSLYAQIWYCK